MANTGYTPDFKAWEEQGGGLIASPNYPMSLDSVYWLARIAAALEDLTHHLKAALPAPKDWRDEV